MYEMLRHFADSYFLIVMLILFILGFVLDFLDLMPPTMVTRSLDDVRAFRAEHGDIIIKPLYGNGGAGVFRLDANDRNLTSLHELFTGFSREPLIAQQFLPDVSVPCEHCRGRRYGPVALGVRHRRSGAPHPRGVRCRAAAPAAPYPADHRSGQ